MAGLLRSDRSIAGQPPDSRRTSFVPALRVRRVRVAFFTLVFAAGCGSSPKQTSSQFSYDGATGSMEGSTPPEDGSLVFGNPDGSQSDAGPMSSVDSCAGDACDQPAVCGDGVVGTGETCDDGNAIPGDGCSGVCQIEPGYTCPTAGSPASSRVQVCGDGVIEGNEAVRRRQHRRRRRLLVGLPGRARLLVHRPRAAVRVDDQAPSCGDGMVEPASSATTATRPRATAAPRRASSSAAGRAPRPAARARALRVLRRRRRAGVQRRGVRRRQRRPRRRLLGRLPDRARLRVPRPRASPA